MQGQLLRVVLGQQLQELISAVKNILLSLSALYK